MENEPSIPAVVDPVVEPFFVRSMPAEHYQGVFGQLHTGIDLSLSKLEKIWGQQFFAFPYSRLVEIVQELKSRFSNERYAEIQRAHLSGKYRVPDQRKYLDTPSFLITHFYNAILLDLLDGRKRSLLDIGSGGSHFPFLVQTLGHEVLATDILWEPTNPAGDRHLFEDMRDLFGLQFGVLSVEARTPIRLDRRFDIVTAMNLAFGIYYPKVTPWSPEDWNWHIDDVLDNVLNDGGVYCVQPTELRTDPEAWKLIKSRAAVVQEDRRVAVIKKK